MSNPRLISIDKRGLMLLEFSPFIYSVFLYSVFSNFIDWKGALNMCNFVVESLFVLNIVGIEWSKENRYDDIQHIQP